MLGDIRYVLAQIDGCVQATVYPSVDARLLFVTDPVKKSMWEMVFDCHDVFGYGTP